MKQIAIILLVMLFLSCERENELEYDFIISKSSYVDGTITDSIAFYYTRDNKMVYIDECLNTFDCREYTVIYESNIIQGLYGSYLVNDENQVYKWISNNSHADYHYEDGLIVQERHFIDSLLENEHYYEYNGLNFTKDSGIYYNLDNGQIHVTVYKNRYTDTIAPQFLIGFCGLFEFPLKHQNLIRESESIENGILYKYSYDISENELIEYKELYDTFHGISNVIWTTRYYYIE